MTNKNVGVEQVKAAIENNLGMSNYKIGALLGVNESTIRKRKEALAKSGWSPEHNWTSTVPDGYKISGVSQYVDENGNVLRQWVKSTEDKQRQYEMLTAAVEALIQDLPKIAPTSYDHQFMNEHLLAVYPLGDPHIGMLSWAKESGEDWDLVIAEDMFITIFDRVIKAAPRCDKAVILNLGDFFHYDNMEGVTSRSHNTLDRDGRYAKMVQVGVKIMRQMITTALLHHKEVEVTSCQGNHDDTGSIFLSIALQHIYENEPRVIINDSPAPFHYIRFGKVLIGAHHGHTCKMAKLPGVMAADRAKDWGETEFRYWMTGHIHHDSKIEAPGCMVESFRTIAAKDAYATWGGWRSGRDTKCIVMHKEFGEVERHTISLLQLSQKETDEPGAIE